MSMLRSAGKAAGKRVRGANATGAAKAIEMTPKIRKLMEKAMRPKRSLASKVRTGTVGALAGYGAYDLLKKGVDKLKGRKSKTTTAKPKLKGRKKWASEESYVPQSQRKMYGGSKMKKYAKGGAKPDYIDLDGDGNTTEPMKSTYMHGGGYYNRGRKIPGMVNGM